MSKSVTTNQEKIDLRQLKAILRTSLLIDLRGTTNLFGSGFSKTSLRIPPFVWTLIMYFLIGIPVARLMWKINDLFWGLYVLLWMVMSFCFFTILLEFSNLILSPDDFPVLSPHPVNSKTFFAAKVIHMVIYVTMLVAPLALLPSAIAVIKHGNAIFFPLIFASVWGAALAVSMFSVVFYTATLRFVTRERIHRYVSYLQLAMLLFFYCSNMLFSRLLQGLVNLKSAHFDRSYLYLTPPAWFASWASLFSGGVTAFQVWAAVGGVAILAFTCYIAISRLSMRYAMTLSDLVVEQHGRVEKRIKEGLFIRIVQAISTWEDRVVWRLIKTQFKYDTHYKIGILMIIPLTIFNLYLGLKGGESLLDPFAISQDAGFPWANAMFYMVFTIVPYVLIFNTIYSSAYQAAWIYFTSPADRTALVISSARFILFYFCIPYLIFICIIFTYLFGNFMHAFLHCVTIFLLVLGLINMLILIMPRFPFSVPMQSGRQTWNMLLVLFISQFLILGLMKIVYKKGFGGVVGYISITLGLALLNLLLHHIQGKTIPHRMEKCEFVEIQ